jgi:predicted GNAT family N-acyltransferase
VSAQKLPESLAKKLPRYPELGATLIGRLARDLSWRSKEIGRLLLLDALRRSARLSAEAGAVVAVTGPKDKKARAFYESYGFQALDDRRLFLTMKEVLAREARGWIA